MNSLLSYPSIDLIKDCNDTFNNCFLMLKESKKHYVNLRRIRSEFRVRDIETGEIIRSSNYLKVLRLRTKVKKQTYKILLAYANSLRYLIDCITLHTDKLSKLKVINVFKIRYIKKLTLCLIKKLFFILKRCSSWNDKRIYKMKVSKKATLKHSIDVYAYKSEIEKIHDDINMILPYYGSIDDIKISNRKDYVKAIFHELNII